MEKTNRFSALRKLRDQRQDDEPEGQLEQEQEASEFPEDQNDLPSTISAKSADADEMTETGPESVPLRPDITVESKKRGPGRPPGRRSNPDYTQISAYIPLDLLLEVQDELAEERREKKQRTPRPVSDLVEELLENWLKKRKRKNSDR